MIVNEKEDGAAQCPQQNGQPGVPPRIGTEGDDDGGAEFEQQDEKKKLQTIDFRLFHGHSPPFIR